MEQIILFSPLLGAIIGGFFWKSIGEKAAIYLTIVLLFASCFLSWIVFLSHGLATEKITLFRWIVSGNLSADWSIRLDRLTSIMLVVVTSVSALVHLYSVGYMAHDENWQDDERYKARFFAYLSFFTFAMLMLVTSDNLVQMFFGWEGVGVASYLLIGFYYKKQSANGAAIKAFVVNRVGDFGFALGIFALFMVTGSINFDDIFVAAPKLAETTLTFLWTDWNAANLIAILLFIGAMGKSAQFFLHTWLPDAMEGPTPVSALIHAATMVTAGVFLVARMSPLYEFATFTNLFITFIGAATAIFAASIALTQNDIKRVIAYSTCSQLGYMFFAAGVGAYNASIFHLTTHAFFKALLFLSAGSVIHAMHHEQDMRKMGGLFKKIPFTATMMWIGSLAIIGFPYLSGYYSKESILENAFYASNGIAYFAYLVGILTALLTAFYSWRLLFLTFHGENRSNNKTYDHAHESPLVMTVPLFILAIGSIFSGIFFADYFIGYYKKEFWDNAILLTESSHKYLPLTQSLISKSAVAIGILVCVLIYSNNLNRAKNLSYNLDPLYSLSKNKWYVDELYHKVFVLTFFKLANFFWKRGDEKTIDGLGPNGVSWIISKSSSYVSLFQSGYLFHYAFAMLGGLVIILTWFLYY